MPRSLAPLALALMLLLTHSLAHADPQLDRTTPDGPDADVELGARTHDAGAPEDASVPPRLDAGVHPVGPEGGVVVERPAPGCSCRVGADVGDAPPWIAGAGFALAAAAIFQRRSRRQYTP